MKPIKKAYRLNPLKIKEPWFYDDYVVYAKDDREARNLILTGSRRHDIELLEGGEATYINLPVKRDKNYDLFAWEGKELTLNEIAKEEAEIKRVKGLYHILANPNIDWCYIKKNGYYYRDGSCGYTEYVAQAGVFTKAKAVSEAIGVREITIIPIDVDKHNEIIEEEIRLLTKHLILTKAN